MDSNADCADFADCNSSLLEVCSQLKHDKKFLEEENASLHNYLLMADDFIKEYSAKEYSMSQKLSSLSEAVVERDKLLEFVEKENLSRAAMQRLIDEQKYHNQQLEAKLAVTGDIEAVLNDKILKLEKELMKRDGQVKELFEIVRDYEVC
ncbi:hypothetical protein MN116_001967 [Schistosoma mekongi]|uniref:Uncharacterized protein n=1 Tax=Schistosoma mekongi TaxID=38744 RepID=A0AAE1ZJJ1_SCHME|nr:hypothetical protein MN116_001967 [Schistosoma mekongi]